MSRRARRVLFLDFDGVLNDGRTGYGALKRRHVRRLQAIYLLTRCEVVISASWRHGQTVGQLAATLKKLGYGGPVVDKTPEEDSTHRERGDEIHAWLRAKGQDVTAYAILDDESDMRGVRTHLVQTDTWYGITARDALRAVAMLLGHP